jgi:hypothetical protein
MYNPIHPTWTGEDTDIEHCLNCTDTYLEEGVVGVRLGKSGVQKERVCVDV